MDTWATSSLTPQIVTGWVDDPDLFERTFPMDLRPQGPEIIRTWLFDTVVRSWFEHGTLPWSDTTINGWVLDPDRKKMSKSKGNVVTPMPLVEEYGADALRYWACNGRPGVDTAVDYGSHEDRAQARDQDPQRVEVHARTSRATPATTHRDARRRNPLDRSMLAALADVDRRRDDGVRRVRLRPRARAHRAVLLVVLRRLRRAGEGPRVRRRRRRRGRVGRRPRCGTALSTLLRLFAPILPFVTEEVWSWWQEGSIHRDVVARRGDAAPRATRDPLVFAVAADVLAAVRKEKSEQKRSLTTPVDRVVVHDTAERLAALRRPRTPTCARRARSRRSRPRSVPELLVEVELAPPDATT